MSNGFAIAAVTAVIRRTLLEAFAASNLSDVVGSISVTAEPPDRVIAPATGDPTQVNIFLRQVSTNPAFRNWDLPSRNHSGEPISGPPLALDLHYFISVYGAETFYGEILLGHAAQALHQHAIFSRELIARALAPQPPDGSVPPELGSSGIETQLELIKLLPEAVDSEEMSRLWSAVQGQYRPTVAYRAGVVLIEPTSAGAPAPPVRSAEGRVQSLSRLQLHSVGAAGGEADAIFADSVIVLRGGEFSPGDMSVEIGQTLAVPASEDTGRGEIQLDLSSLASPPRAGLQSLRLVRRREQLGADVSNTLALSIRPRVAAISVAPGSVDGDVASGTISLSLEPPVSPSQSVSLLLNSRDQGRAYRLAAPARNGAAAGVAQLSQIQFPFERLGRGSYLLRLSVDGAESLLSVDPSGVYTGPEVSI